MFYESFEEYIEANMRQAYKIVERRLKNEDKENMIDSLDFLKHKLIEQHNLLKWQEDAIKEVVTDEQYAMILKLSSAYMRNDFITNCEWAKKMVKEGKLKPSGFKIFGKFSKE